MTAQRWLIFAIVAVAAVFAVEGGEYGTRDWLKLRQRERREREQVAELERLVDSLERAAVALEHDPRVQERVARESFGMIRRGEFLYRLVPGESDASGGR